jgi:hypothetical protein
MLKRYLAYREGVELGKDVMQFLGGLNAGYVLLAVLALRKLSLRNEVESSVFWVLSLVNALKLASNETLGKLFPIRLGHRRSQKQKVPILSNPNLIHQSKFQTICRNHHS